MTTPLSPSQLHENLIRVRTRLEQACHAAGRPPEEIELMAVTKTHPAPTVELAWEIGLRRFGENRVQEAATKIPDVRPPAHWELIGHLQTNKARAAVTLFQRIQSVDRHKLVHTLARLVNESQTPPLPVLLQINAGRDPAKFGCDPDQAESLLIAALETGCLQVDGLMTIAPFDDHPQTARRAFARLRQIRDHLTTQTGHPLPTLSMGMTSDLEDAILEGSTLLRIGSALFGSRP